MTVTLHSKGRSRMELKKKKDLILCLQKKYLKFEATNR